MHTAMIISPHADDAAAFCGATVAKFAGEGWRVILVRVTDDAKDSLGLTVEETKKRNTAELHEAAKIMGVCKATVRRYTAKGVLPHYRTPGNQRRFKLNDIIAFIENQRK